MFFVSWIYSFQDISTKKSWLKTKFDSFSRIGTHISSVAPGKTVDSYTTISFFFKTNPTVLLADLIKERSGILSSSRVGTVTTKKLHS